MNDLNDTSGERGGGSLERMVRRWLLIPKDSMQMHWDREYGFEQRTGWSVFVDGSCLVQFERWLAVALIKTWWRRARLWDDDASA